MKKIVIMLSSFSFLGPLFNNFLNFSSGELAHTLRFLASVVSQSFLAFGDILELHRKYLELSGGVNRIFEMEELLDVAQNGMSLIFLSS